MAIQVPSSLPLFSTLLLSSCSLSSISVFYLSSSLSPSPLLLFSFLFYFIGTFGPKGNNHGENVNTLPFFIVGVLQLVLELIRAYK
jgi:hypothetical protein